MPCSKSTPIVDANVILRYLLNDHIEMSLQAKEMIEQGARTKPEIIAEVIYVLKGVYQVTREDISSYIKMILHCIECTDSDIVEYAVDLLARFKLDFIDCLLIAYNILYDDAIFSFDKKLNKKLAELQNEKVISQDKQKQMEYTVRQKAILDYNQGMLEARQEGKQETRISMVIEMLQEGLNINTISKISKLSITEIEELKKNI